MEIDNHVREFVKANPSQDGPAWNWVFGAYEDNPGEGETKLFRSSNAASVKNVYVLTCRFPPEVVEAIEKFRN